MKSDKTKRGPFAKKSRYRHSEQVWNKLTAASSLTFPDNQAKGVGRMDVEKLVALLLGRAPAASRCRAIWMPTMAVPQVSAKSKKRSPSGRYRSWGHSIASSWRVRSRQLRVTATQTRRPHLGPRNALNGCGGKRDGERRRRCFTMASAAIPMAAVRSVRPFFLQAFGILLGEL